jgi:hypothetical protein
MDIRSFSRICGATCLVLGPLAAMVGTGLSPVHDGDSAAVAIARAAAHRGAMRAHVAVELAIVLMVPAMLMVSRLGRRGAPWLAMLGGWLASLGWLAGLASGLTIDLVVLHAYSAPHRKAAISLARSVMNDPRVGALVGVFVISHLLGMLLLGIALWRSRVVPAWAAVTVGLSMFLHAALHSTTPRVDAATFVLLEVGAAACAWRILRMEDRLWDLPAADLSGVPATGHNTEPWVTSRA